MIDYRSYLNKSPCIVNGQFKSLNQGLNDFIFEASPFEKDVLHAFVAYNNLSKLYIFLSAVGINKGRPYPVFHRISWNDKFDGIKIFFDDPTRVAIDFAPAFYFGRKEISVFDRISSIIDRIKELYKLENSDICFVSSSNGGYGAIYLCDRYLGSKCVALCPQLDVSLFLKKRFETFINLLGINPDDYQDRLNLYRIAENKSSKFIIFSNLASRSDRDQIDGFFNFLQKKYRIGVNIIAPNICFILDHIEGAHAHLIQPDLEFSLFLISSFNHFTDSDFALSVEAYLSQLRINSAKGK